MRMRSVPSRARPIARKTGARGLRSIMEAILLDTMFELPALDGVQEVVISDEVVEGNAPGHSISMRSGMPKRAMFQPDFCHSVAIGPAAICLPRRIPSGISREFWQSLPPKAVQYLNLN